VVVPKTISLCLCSLLSSISISNKTMQMLLVSLLAALSPLGTQSFSTQPLYSVTSPHARNNLMITTRGRQPAAAVATSSQDNSNSVMDVDPNMLKKFDAEIEKEVKRKEKAMQELSKLSERLESLQEKKQQYLNGLEIGLPKNKNFSETTLRSAVKAFTWRLIGGSVTFFTSLRFSGSMATAFSIVCSDFFSKSATMFIGERLMNKSQAGRKGGADDLGRSLVKALIWRLFAICNTLVFAVFFAKDITIAYKIAGFDSVFKTSLMFFFERIWARIEWGKEYLIEFSI